MSPREPGYEVVVIGGSLGGTRALETLLRALPAAFPLPILVVLHRAADVGGDLAGQLAAASPLPVEEACDKAPLRPGRVFLAPADYHLLLDGGHLALAIDPPVRHARPSVDVLFESAADCCGEGVLAVVLTGNNDDGAGGAARVKARGGSVVVQDPETAEGAGMPRAAIAAAAPDRVLPLAEIGPLLARAAAAGARLTTARETAASPVPAGDREVAPSPASAGGRKRPGARERRGPSAAKRGRP